MTQQARNGHHSDDDPEQFYRSFWRSHHWGAAEPNLDERSRLRAIIELLNHCDLGGRPQILDLGCGRGWLSQALARYGEVLGTDVFAASVERARELFPDLVFEQIDLRGLIGSRGPESFDLVVSSEVIEHVEPDERSEFVGGILRLLKPGGHAILTTPRGELWPAWQRGFEGQQPTEQWITEAELDRMLISAGFRVERRTRAHVYGITPLSRVFASRLFRAMTRILPAFDRMTYASRIYQVVLLRRPAVIASDARPSALST